MGIAYTVADQTEKAKEAFRNVLDIEPENKDAIQGLAKLYFDDKQFDKVVDLMKKVLKVDPEDKDAIANLALAYDYTGNKEMAVQTYENALEKNPNDTDLMFNLARLRFMDGEYDKAIDLFNRVLGQNPNDYDANVSVGNAYLQMGDEYRKTLVEKENNNQEVTVAERERLESFYQDSIPYLEKALQIWRETRPDQPVPSGLYNNLGIAYVQVGDSEKGAEYFELGE